MKLSEAIRLGAMSSPQTYFVLYDAINGGTCAMGAAYYAVGKLFSADVIPAYDLWPVAAKPLQCPCCAFHGPLSNVITDLNDFHDWTRERIADWVETFEPTAEETTNTPDLSEQVSQ